MEWAIGIVSILLAAVFFFFAIRRNKQIAQQRQQEQQQRINGFNDVLLKANFTASDKIGDFWIDSENKLWCKYLVPVVFSFADIVDIKFHKNAKTKTADYNTYTVFIYTKHAQHRTVEFACGKDMHRAEYLRATVTAILKNVNAEKTQQRAQPEKKHNAALEIKRYKSLLDEGIITQEEFDQKKKQLLEL